MSSEASLPGGEPVAPPAKVPDEKKRTEYVMLVQVCLDKINEELARMGLTPIGAVQAMLISVGAVGSMMKYGFEPDDYPEVCLGAGLVWAGFDKYTEFQKLQKISPVAVSGPPAEGR
ncbi:MAG: hypothetical protein M0Z38_08410 [Deltaproteobacteria bacterium]|nr:hypothetical protein [Deltaproteobacteria bacterium]